MRDDLEQEVGRRHRGLDRGEIGRLVLVAHGAVRDAHRAVVQLADQGVDLGAQRGLGQLLGKAPQLAAAGDGRMVVEKHAVGVAALAALEGHRNDLSALGVIAETGRVRHADELEIHQRRLDLERFRHELAQLCGIGAIGDDQIFAIVEPIRADRIGRARQRHRERPAAYFTLLHRASLSRDGRSRPCDRPAIPTDSSRSRRCGRLRTGRAARALPDG